MWSSKAVRVSVTQGCSRRYSVRAGRCWCAHSGIGSSAVGRRNCSSNVGVGVMYGVDPSSGVGGGIVVGTIVTVAAEVGVGGGVTVSVVVPGGVGVVWVLPRSSCVGAMCGSVEADLVAVGQVGVAGRFAVGSSSLGVVVSLVLSRASATLVLIVLSNSC